MPLWYKLGLKPNTIGTSIDLANEFFESGLFVDVDPAFIFDFDQNCTSDPNFFNLWGLNPLFEFDINVCDAWTISEGTGIKVGVLDNGVYKQHNDLNDNISDLSYDTQTGSSPSVFTDFKNHGTHVAGIIAAEKNNSLQVVGVSPQSKIISISNTLEASANISEELADGINWGWKNGADIISNSWGDYGGLYYNLIHSALLENAILDALNNGRNGLGTLLVFASGNSAPDIDYPANFHKDILCVGAININGARRSTSGYGSKLDIVAPGDNILSTISYQSIQYRSGTSMAAPHASGVAALTLSINPCLSNTQVNDLIEQTAKKNPNYTFDNISQRPNGTWNNELGYGLVDAYAAVQLAQEVYSPGLDLYIKDNPKDLGQEPNNTEHRLWSSEDIWVRNESDNGLTHQNPEFNYYGEPNYIYVRVINKSCTVSSGEETVTVYWSKSNTGLNWPQGWDGTVTDSDGDPLGGQVPYIAHIPVLNPGEETIVEIPWVVPDPDDYDDNAAPQSFALLARIDASQDPLTDPLHTNPTSLAKYNNNVAWKNLTIVDLINEHIISSLIANPSDGTQSYYLELLKPTNEKGTAVFEDAEVSLKMDAVLYNAWERGGQESQLLDPTSDEKKKLVRGDNVILDNIILDAQEKGYLTLDFNFLVERMTEKSEYTYDLVQRDASTGEIVGGQTFSIRKEPRPTFKADAGPDKEISIEESVTLSAEQINEAAIYNWYDMQGNLIYQGTDLTVSSDMSQKYKLEVIADTDGFKDYDEVEIKVKPFSLEAMNPNPASNQVTINYNAQNATSAYLMVIGTNNTNSNNYIIDPTAQEIFIDISNYQTGHYVVALVCDGKIVAFKALLVE